MAYRDSFSFGYGLTPWVKRLILANAGVLLLIWAVPAVGGYLAFVPARVLTRPWTPLTYMFVHAGFLHLLFNMLFLFFFGPPLEAQWGSREFLKFYVVAGLGAAALSFLFAPHEAIVGASGAVLGVMLAFAMNWPDAPIYFFGIFPIKAKWLVAILGAMAFFGAVGGSHNGIANFAHLGGLLSGYLYLKFSDPAAMALERLKKRGTRSRISVVSGERKREPSEPPPQGRAPRDEERVLDEVDRVLDKISAEGMASLSPEERRLLDDVSRRRRSN